MDYEKKGGKAKEAIKRDWEQTRHDFNKKSGQELNQGVGDTLKQAAGKDPIPPRGVPTEEKK